jgi:hypothetical protein
MTEPTKDSTVDATEVSRAPYETPRLQTFGSYASLTRNVGLMSALADGGMGMTTKTR